MASKSTPTTVSNKKINPLVGIIMGSKSDLPIMSAAQDFLNTMGIASEIAVVSAHRTPDLAIEYAKTARARGLRVIITGAGGSAHLSGVIASSTTLPVIGVPIKSSNSMDGWASVLSTLQMPNGVPVATVALDSAHNAGILAAQIIGTSDNDVAKKLDKFKQEMRDKIINANK